MIGRTDHDVDRMMIIVLLPETEFCEVCEVKYTVVILVPGHQKEIMNLLVQMVVGRRMRYLHVSIGENISYNDIDFHQYKKILTILLYTC